MGKRSSAGGEDPLSRLLSVALLPAAVLLAYIYHKDTIEKEPWKLLLKLFLAGALCAIPAALLEEFGVCLISGVKEQWLYRGLEAFLVVAVAEEGCKFAFLCTTWRSDAFDYRYDAIVYAVCVSLGFAALENILYVFEYGFATGLFRAFTSVPGHCFFGVFMGHWYGKAKYARYYGLPNVKGMLALSAVVPVLLHGFYDYCCFMSDSLVFVLMFYVFLAVFFCAAIRCVRKTSRYDVQVLGRCGRV